MPFWVDVIIAVAAGFGLLLLLTPRPNYAREVDEPRERFEDGLRVRPKYGPGIVR